MYNQMQVIQELSSLMSTMAYSLQSFQQQSSINISVTLVMLLGNNSLYKTPISTPQKCKRNGPFQLKVPAGNFLRSNWEFVFPLTSGATRDVVNRKDVMDRSWETILPEKKKRKFYSPHTLLQLFFFLYLFQIASCSGMGKQGWLNKNGSYIFCWQ